MTNTPPNSPSEPPRENGNVAVSVWRWLKKPSTLVGGGILLTLGVAGYAGVQYFVYQRLSPLLSAQLSNLLQRPVEVGEVKDFSWNRIVIGRSTLPKQENDPDNAEVEEIIVNFNLLPVLVARPLRANVTLIDPNVYIEQDKTGKWVELPEFPEGEGGDLPIDLDIDVNLEDADVVLVPNALKKPVTLEAEGQAGYLYQSSQEQQVSYDLDASVLNSTVNLVGESQIGGGDNFGQTKAQVLIKELNLGELVALIPNSPARVRSGQFNADFNIDLPSLQGVEGTQGNGDINLSNLVANIQPIKAPIKADIAIDLEGEKLLVDQFQLSLGKFVTQVQGNIDWEEGLNLNVIINPFRIPALLRDLNVNLPIKLEGEIASKIQLRGEVLNPIASGVIENTKPLQIEKTGIKELETRFQATLDKVLLSQVQIVPTEGGQILAKGQVQPNLREKLENNQQIDWTKFPIALDFKADLPTQKLINPYIDTTRRVTLSSLTATGQIRGTVDKPQGKVNWNLPNPSNVAGVGIYGNGEVLLSGQNIGFKNTLFQTDGGQLSINGTGNLKTQNLRANVTADSFELTPFIPVVCQEFVECPDAIYGQEVSLRNADANVAAKLNELDLNKIQGTANAVLAVNDGNVTVNGNLNQGNVNANFRTADLNLTPYIGLYCQETNQCPDGILSQNITVANANGRVSGRLDDLNLNTIDGTLNAVLGVNGGNVAVNADLTQGNLQSTLVTSQIYLNPYIEPYVDNLTVPVNLNRARINLSGSLPEILQQEQINLEPVNLDLVADLSVDGSPIDAAANVRRGIIDAVAETGSLPINQFVPDLPISADLVSSQVNLTGNLNSLIQSLDTNPDLSSFTGRATAQIEAASGTINALSRFNMNQFTANVVASGIKPRELCDSFSVDCSEISLVNEPVNAAVDLRGSFASIFDQNATIPIRVSRFTANWDEQQVSGDGTLLITDLTRKPDIATANFNIQGSSNLDQLPLEEILTLLPVQRSLLPEELKLTGVGEFSGQFQGQNLLTAPTAAGNTLLTGDLSLSNFSLNDRVFEPNLKGKINAGLGQDIALNLQGQEDQIAAQLTPCTRDDCIAPYLPSSFAIRQTYGDVPPFIATGERQGDRLLTEVGDFPLDLLKIAPLREYGIEGYVRGDVRLTADIDLFTLNGSGTLEVDTPGVGLIEGDKITAQVAYRDGIAQLQAAQLAVGRSNYDVDGAFNLNTGAVNAQLTVDRGYVEDILTALKIADVQSLINFIQFSDEVGYASASALQPIDEIVTENGTIKEKVNLLARIDQQIKALAENLKKGGIPTELDIRGAFTAQATLAGTLQDPQLGVAFQGNRWQWQPQSPIPNIVPPLGLVTEADQAIPIRNVHLQATLDDGVVNLETAGLQLRDMVVEVQGEGSLEQIDANFAISSLSIDTIKEFVELPLDVTGDINLNGQVTGQTLSPKIEGNFAFVNGAINARLIGEDVEGQFLYDNDRLIAQTVAPESIQLYASIPYPTQPETNDQVEVKARIGTEALKWVSLLTQNQVVWVDGQGSVNLDVTGQLDTREGFDFSFVANGQVNFENATLASQALADPLILNGTVNFNQDVVQIDQLRGQYDDSNVLISGVLPIFELQPVANPLTVALEQGEIDIEGLYRGEVEGNIGIRGTALKPTIDGGVTLANGRIFVPETQTEEVTTTQAREQLAYRRWFKPNLVRPAALPIVPTFQDFQINLENLAVRQRPLYSFDFGGNITLNGTLETFDLNQLQPNGSIKLGKGQINVAQISFVLDRRKGNTIAFVPNQGIFNPELNIGMRTIVSEVPNSRKRISEYSSEIYDDSLNQVQRIDVNLLIDGQLRQLLPGIGRSGDSLCQLRPDDFYPIRQETRLSEAELNRLESCIQELAMLDASKDDFFQNPAIKLTSRPPRPEGQIVRLLGEQFLAIADSLQTGSTEQLLQSGIIQIALPMVFQGVIYDIETSIADVIDATDFRVVPFLEAIYSLNAPPEEAGEVEDPTFLRFTYDYNQNEFKVRYERQF